MFTPLPLEFADKSENLQTPRLFRPPPVYLEQ